MKTKFKYIHDEPMNCPGCKNLSKGMIGVNNGVSNTILNTPEPHYLFENGFLLEESFLLDRSDLFQKIEA